MTLSRTTRPISFLSISCILMMKLKRAIHFQISTFVKILYEELTSSAPDACTEKLNNICCNRAWMFLFSMCCSGSLFAFNITYFKVFTACYYFLVNGRHFSSYFYQQLMMSSKDKSKK